ncbi:hypothetical protein [Vulcanococcus limneticus]|uniref:hypothetical protein n=1 Tax=Vulcanococcus limneticus TaxID=2170428 RepID=UPI00398BD92B
MLQVSSRLTLQELIDGLLRFLVEEGADSLEKPGKVSTISPFDYNAVPDDSSITYLQGIKGGDRPDTFLLVGANDSPGPNPQGFAYVGPLDPVTNPAFNGSSGSGTWYPIAVPDSFGAAGTSVYGPDNLDADLVNYVGAFTRDLGDSAASSTNPSIVGFTYTGAVDGSTTAGYREVQGITDEGFAGTYTFVHSVDGGLAVGNTDLAASDGRTGYFSLKSTAFIVSLADGSQMPIQFDTDDTDDSDLITHTAYAIWYNGDGQYTIAGGSGLVLDGGQGVGAGAGYLVDYDSVTGQFSHYTEFDYQNRSSTDLITHFEGIYRDASGDYWLPATSVALNPQEDLAIASVVRVERDRSGGFDAEAQWLPLQVKQSGTGVESILSTGNSLFGDAVVGFANYPTSANGLTQADYVIQGNWLLPQGWI